MLDIITEVGSVGVTSLSVPGVCRETLPGVLALTACTDGDDWGGAEGDSRSAGVALVVLLAARNLLGLGLRLQLRLQ